MFDVARTEDRGRASKVVWIRDKVDRRIETDLPLLEQR